MATLQHVNLPGGRVEYRWIGQKQSVLRDVDQPVLVFLHEGLGCIALWKEFPDQVAEVTGLPALVYSRVGYGGSDPCVLPRPLTYMHDEAKIELPALLSALGIGRHILIGHSDGASISLIYAGSGAREGLLGLAVLAPHSFCEDISIKSIQAAHRAYEETDLRSRLAKYHGDNVDYAFRGWCDAWLTREFRHWNIEEYVKRIIAPVLVIQGEDDEYGTAAQVDFIAQQAGGRVETQLLPCCGHSPHRDQPDVTRDALKSFIRKLTSF